MFSFRCWWKWETPQKLKSINNKYFMCVTINKMTKGNIVFVIPVRINYTRTRQYVWSKCYITNWCFKRLWTWSLLFYISQELSLSRTEETSDHPGQSFPLSLCGPISICRANAHMVYGLKHQHFTSHSITTIHSIIYSVGCNHNFWGDLRRWCADCFWQDI